MNGWLQLFRAVLNPAGEIRSRTYVVRVRGLCIDCIEGHQRLHFSSSNELPLLCRILVYFTLDNGGGAKGSPSLTGCIAVHPRPCVRPSCSFCSLLLWVYAVNLCRFLCVCCFVHAVSFCRCVAAVGCVGWPLVWFGAVRFSLSYFR